MRRRVRESQPPDRLLTFVPDQWPDGGWGAWVDARVEWADEHGWPGPDEPDGLDAARQTPDEPWDQSLV